MEFLELFKELLSNPLQVLNEWLLIYGTWVYVFLFLIVFAETGLVVMPLLPGDSLLFSVGVLAATTQGIDIAVVIPLLMGAALMGDNVNYFVGHKFSDWIKSRNRILFLKKEHIEKTEAFYEKHGGKTVILARFVPIVRTVAPFVAGAGSMKYPRYIFYCLIGAILWVCGITLLGYALGENEWVKKNFEKVVLGIVFLSVLPMIIEVVKRKLKK